MKVKEIDPIAIRIHHANDLQNQVDITVRDTQAVRRPNENINISVEALAAVAIEAITQNKANQVIVATNMIDTPKRKVEVTRVVVELLVHGPIRLTDTRSADVIKQSFEFRNGQFLY